MRFRILALFALLPLCAWAQTTTTYTGTIRDLSGAAVTSGNVTFSLNPSVDTTISGTARFSPMTITCSVSGTGSVLAGDGVSPCVVTRNTALTPTGTSYTVCIQPYFTTPGSCFVDYAVTSSKDISTVAPTPALSPFYNYASTSQPNTFSGLGTFLAGITGTGSLGTLTAGSGILSGAHRWLGSDTFTTINNRCQAYPTGSTTAGIQECIATLGSQGGEIDVPSGNYTITACIAVPAGTPSLRLVGAGMTGVATAGTGTTIKSSTTDLICPAGSSLHGLEIDHMVLDSESGGGHIFNFSGVTGGLSQVHFHDVSLIQKNTAKSVVVDVQAAGAGCIYGPFVMDNFIMNYAAGNTVPAINIACDNPNGIVIDRFRANGSATAGNYAIWIENNNATSGGNGVVVSNGVFEVPQAGAINLLSLTNPVLENNGIFDLSGAPTAILTNVDKGAGGFLSNSPSISGHYSLGGTTTFPDVKINATNVYGGKVTDSTLNWLDGGSAAAGTGRAVQVLNSRVNNKQNLASLESGLQTNGDLCWYNSSGTHSYCFYQTSAGVFFLKVDGTATALSFNSSGQITSNLTVTGNTNLNSGTTTLGTLNFAHLFASSTAPTISSGFGTSPSVTANNGTAAFEINVGTGGTANSGVVGLPAASNGWICDCNDITTQSTSNFLCKQSASSTTSATLTEYNTAGAATAWVASDKVRVSCSAY